MRSPIAHWPFQIPQSVRSAARQPSLGKGAFFSTNDIKTSSGKISPELVLFPFH